MMPRPRSIRAREGPKLYDKWFMQKIPPKGLNLNVPMGAELRHEFAKPSDFSDPDAYKARSLRGRTARSLHEHGLKAGYDHGGLCGCRRMVRYRRSEERCE